MKTSSRSTVALWAALALVSLGPGSRLAAQAAPKPKEAPVKAPEAPAKPRPVHVVVKPAKGQKKAPERVTLPGPGEHAVEDLLALAATLSGRNVRIESERVRETRIKVTAKLGVSQVTYDELTVLLAAHHVYLFAVTDPLEGEILVASWDPNWKAETPRRTRVIEVGQRSFQAAWTKIEKAVAEKNKQDGEGTVVAVPDERTGKIILGAATDELLEEIARVAAPEEKKDPNRLRLYTYVGEHRSASDLEQGVLDGLGDGERARVRIVVAAKGNRLLLRAPESLWTKIEGLLKELDKAR